MMFKKYSISSNVCPFISGKSGFRVGPIWTYDEILYNLTAMKIFLTPVFIYSDDVNAKDID